MSHHGEMDKLSTERVDGRGRGDGENRRRGGKKNYDQDVK